MIDWLIDWLIGWDFLGGSKKPKGKGKAKPKKVPKKKKRDAEDNEFMEPAEDSDDGDFETREVDYETSSSEYGIFLFSRANFWFFFQHFFSWFRVRDDMEDIPERETTMKGIDEEIEEMEEDDDEEEEAKVDADGDKDNSNQDARRPFFFRVIFLQKNFFFRLV